jgi:hypothetical protein
MTSELKICFIRSKLIKMEFIWQEFCIEEFLDKLLSMIIFQSIIIIILCLLGPPKIHKFGSWFWKNVGLNCLTHIKIRSVNIILNQVDILIKPYMHFQQPPRSTTKYLMIRKSAINFLRRYIISLSKEVLCVAVLFLNKTSNN